MLVILPLPVPMSVMMLTMLLRSCPHLYLPAFPGSARGRCYYKPSHLPPSPLPLLVQCVSCTDAQLPSLFPQRFYCTAFKASLPMAPPVCAAHCSFHAGRCRADICEGGGLVPGLPLSASVPTPGLRTCLQTYPHHNALPLLCAAAFHWARSSHSTMLHSRFVHQRKYDNGIIGGG